MEEKVVAILQKKDDAKRWKKRYTKEINIKMALLFDQAIQQAALPPEQRPVSLEQICKAAGVQIGKYEVGPYLEEMKDEIKISYPQDIIAIITEKKNIAAAWTSSSGVRSEAGNVTPDPTLSSVQSLLGNPESYNSALGK